MRHHINAWLNQHIPTMPAEYSRLDHLDGLPRNAAVVTR
jgi:hypothetical protein